MDEDGVGHDGDLRRYEADCCHLVLPFLRVAALLRHYIFQQDLPDIGSDIAEFDKLATFLQLKTTERDEAMMDDSSAMSQQILSTSVSALNWFTSEGREFVSWLESLKSSIGQVRDVTLLRKALKVNLTWKQPKLLSLPKNYDQIFQVMH